MRYVVLTLLGVFSVILSGSLVSGINIAGIQVDIVLLLVVCIALLDKTSAPIIFAAAAGLLTDILFSTVLGVYAISYTAAAIAVMAVFRNTVRFNFLMLFAAGAGGYLLKEVVMAILAYALGARFNPLPIFARYTLPAAALNGVLLLVAYLLMARLYRESWMKAKPKFAGDDFSQL